MQRRDFLKGVAVAGTALSLPQLAMRRVIADTRPGAAPRRLLILSHCHGWPRNNWRMTPPGTSDDNIWKPPSPP